MLDGEVSAPLFQTGLGKPVGLKQSSIRRALSVLQEEGDVEMGESADSILFHPSLLSYIFAKL